LKMPFKAFGSGYAD